MKIQNIIVGIDFSSHSETAFRRACALAASSIASSGAPKLFLVHALEDSDYHGQDSWLLKGKTFESLLQRSRKLASAQLEELAHDVPSGVEVQVELSDMAPDKAIIDATERHKADLVVIGTHGRTGFERLTLARNTERIVRNCPCSVLVARPSNVADATGADATARDATFQRILVPTDFSESADQALSMATELVAEGGQIDVLHCWLVYFYPTGYHGLYEETMSIEPALADSIRQQGKALLQKYGASRGTLHFEEKFSSPVSGVQEALEHTPYDLVVMGSHGRHGVKRLLLGSTAEATVRHANCSVLVARQRL